ncbi:MAG: hypothetical protein ACTTKH_01950 [Treponema sp.]
MFLEGAEDKDILMLENVLKEKVSVLKKARCYRALISVYPPPYR